MAEHSETASEFIFYFIDMLKLLVYCLVCRPIEPFLNA